MSFNLDEDEGNNYNDLDHRLNNVENWKQNMSVDMINKLLDQFAHRINMNL